MNIKALLYLYKRKIGLKEKEGYIMSKEWVLENNEKIEELVKVMLTFNTKEEEKIIKFNKANEILETITGITFTGYGNKLEEDVKAVVLERELIDVYIEGYNGVIGVYMLTKATGIWNKVELVKEEGIKENLGRATEPKNYKDTLDLIRISKEL